ncbi:MAG: hypothetical protein V3T08_09425 [Gemmatimonadota bacterium]
MARLVDRLLDPGCAIAGLGLDVRLLRETMGSQKAVIVCDNVESFWAGHSQDDWGTKDFPNLAPPFDVVWYEYRPSHRVFDGGRWKTSDCPYTAIGGLVSAKEHEGGWLICTILLGLVPDAERPPGCPDVVFLGEACAQINEHGAPDIDGHYFLFSREIANLQIGYENALWNMVTPIYLAICFMHCRNVVQREVSQPRGPSRQWAREHGRPLVRYHVLDIDPMKATLEAEGGVSKNGLKKALHICRGHFATYTEDAPLFGNYVGTVWKPQHVRGSAQQGAVVKDYEVLHNG